LLVKPKLLLMRHEGLLSLGHCIRKPFPKWPGNRNPDHTTLVEVE
jgi:hypothetical protein